MQWSRVAARYKRRLKLMSQTQWHRWFAWYPVEAEGEVWVWLEFVERQYSVGYWYYRCLDRDTNVKE